MKQQQNKATKTDKLVIEKHVIKNMLGLDIIGEYIVKHYYEHDFILRNFTILIDTENIKYNDENMKLDHIDNIEIIKHMMNHMGFGFNNMFNNEIHYTK